jgi:hypothetical protein
MLRFRRGIPFVSVVLVAAAVAMMLAAALTSWWVLLALIPLTMMVACVAMMAAQRRMPRGPSSAGCGCCAVSPLWRHRGSRPARDAKAAVIPTG